MAKRMLNRDTPQTHFVWSADMTGQILSTI